MILVHAAGLLSAPRLIYPVTVPVETCKMKIIINNANFTIRPFVESEKETALSPTLDESFD